MRVPCVPSSIYPLTIYRVKKEFTTSGPTSGGIFWPVGAVRYWTPQDVEQARKMFMPGHDGVSIFSDHFEVVDWK